MFEAMYKYNLRSIEECDLRLLLDWRNSYKVHSMMLTDHEITWEEHYTWYKHIKEQSVKRNFIFECSGKAIGYIGYTEYDDDNHTCSPGAYLGNVADLLPDAALHLFYVSIDYPFRYLNMIRLNTDIFADNIRALKLNTLLGYDIIYDRKHKIMKNGQERLVYRIMITKNKWLKEKQKLAKYFPFFNNFIYI